MNLNNTISNPEINLSEESFSYSKKNFMFEEAKRTIPIGIEVLEKDLQKTTITLKHGKFNIIAIRLYIPPDKEESLRTWVEKFEKDFNVKVIIQRQSGYSGIQNLFSCYFQNTTLLTNEHIEDIKKILEIYFGKPPHISTSFIEEKKKMNSHIIDLTHIPFIAIDEKNTTDPEDAFFAQKTAKNTYRLTVAIADISCFFEPRGQQQNYATSLGATIYGSDIRLSVLGNLSKFECSHLSTTEKSPAWVLEFEIDKNYHIKLLREPFLAEVKIHHQMNPEDMVISDEVKTLMEIGYILRASRLGEPLEINFENNISFNTNLLVSEIIIQTKKNFSIFLNKYKSKKAIFKVQRTLSLKKKKEIIKELKKINIPATTEIFKSPTLLMEVLTLLQAMSFDARISKRQDLNNAEKILNDLLNVFLKRSYYDIRDQGHAFLHVTSYCDIKGRMAAGIINQIQARTIIQSGMRGYSIAEIKKITQKINRQMKSYGIRFYTLRFTEMLMSKLSLVGQAFQGEIIKIHDNYALISINGFKKWGLVPVSTDIKIGKTIDVFLVGFSLLQQRFLFNEK